jgi:putative flippase GtrA
LPRETAIAGLVRRVLRYGGVGVVVSLIYSLLVIAGMHVVPRIGATMISILAFAGVSPIAWFAHGTISFGDRPHDALQPLRFAVSSAASFIVAVGGMYWITEIAGWSYLMGVAWNWLIIPGANFVIYMLWVFRAKRTGDKSREHSGGRRGGGERYVHL